MFYKKHTGKPTVSYRESVEEALCFGWIDGLKRTIDEERYAQRFTPRKPKSKWSPINISLAEKLIDQGKMTEVGIQAFEQRVAYDEQFLSTRESQELALTPEIEAHLRKHKKAWRNFQNLTPGYKKQYIGWLISAKKPETRERRLKEAVRLLKDNKKLGMK